MYQIAIIGAGQLGSRHLQGVLKINIPVNIEIVDPNPQSILIAKKRAEEIEPNDQVKNVRYMNSISELSDNIDICIIATTASIRFAVFSELVANKKVKNLILEKVLFQKISEYNLTKELIDQNNIKCWVNCPRRLMPVYKEIKSFIKPGTKITYTVIGGEWGLACNAIHFIDNFNFLNEAEDLSYDTSGIYHIAEGKRMGNYEFFGSIYGKSNGSELFLHSRENCGAGWKIQILADEHIWQLDEVNRSITTYSLNNNWQPVVSKFNFLYQSQLTHTVCQDIILRGETELTDYSISSKLHQGMLSSFIALFNEKTGNSKDYCPIT